MEEKHEEHIKRIGWVAFDLALWVSHNGKKANLSQFGGKLKNRTYKGKSNILLQCNLSNTGCKEERKICVSIIPSMLRKVRKSKGE